MAAKRPQGAMSKQCAYVIWTNPGDGKLEGRMCRQKGVVFIGNMAYCKKHAEMIRKNVTDGESSS